MDQEEVTVDMETVKDNSSMKEIITEVTITTSYQVEIMAITLIVISSTDNLICLEFLL